MTAKALTLALAATTAAATFADVFEVKFTVKTKVDEKVANKVISGLYDSDQDKHVFWTIEKRLNEKGKAYNANVAYTGTYFGTSNDELANNGKSVGQNAELIWGDDNENVLVAGAWGTAASKSGQVAGMLDNVPATGTWSAKVNTKMTFDQLLAKYNVEDYDLEKNRENGVIDQMIVDADAALADVEGQLDQIVEALTNLNDTSAFQMIGKSIKQNYTDAKALDLNASKKVEKAQDAYTAYTDALNETEEGLKAKLDAAWVASNDCEVAKAEADWTLSLYTAFVEKKGYEGVTNKLWTKIGELQKQIDANLNIIKADTNSAETVIGLLEKDLAAAWFAVTNETTMIGGVTKPLGTQVVYTNAVDILEKAEAFADGGYLDSWDSEEVYTYAEFAAKKKYTGLSMSTGVAWFSSMNVYADGEAYEYYLKYLADRKTFAEKKLTEAKTARDDAEQKNIDATAKVTNIESQIATLKADGVTALTKQLTAENEELQKQIDDLKAQIEAWKTKAVSQADVDQAKKDAEQASTDLAEAKKAVEDAEKALNDRSSNLETLLKELATAIGLEETGLNDKTLTEIDAEYTAFIEKQESFKAHAEEVMAYAEALADTIGLDLTK